MSILDADKLLRVFKDLEAKWGTSKYLYPDQVVEIINIAIKDYEANHMISHVSNNEGGASMEMYKYVVDKYYRKRDGSSPMEGKKILEVSHGYVFANSMDEAYEVMHKNYPDTESVEYAFRLEKTNIIAM